MKILEQDYEFTKVGNLYVATTNLYHPKLAIRKASGNHYFDFYAVEKLDETLIEYEPGIRVTTRDDLKYLASLGSHWVKAGEKGNTIAGRFFGERAQEATMDDLKGCVFFPALGYCFRGTLHAQGSFAGYWSSTYFSNYHAYYLYFFSSNTSPGTDWNRKNFGFPVRLVKNAN
jgi:hypothetical protein